MLTIGERRSSSARTPLLKPRCGDSRSGSLSARADNGACAPPPSGRWPAINASRVCFNSAADIASTRINTTQDVVVAFTATGGAASLAEVTAGAGTVYIAYSLAPV